MTQSPTNTPSNNELDERSKERIEIEYLFVGHNFPNTEIVDRIQNWANKKVIESLKKARFESYWGDGSPDLIDSMIKELDPTYDKWAEIDKLDEALRKKGDV